MTRSSGSVINVAIAVACTTMTLCLVGCGGGGSPTPAPPPPTPPPPPETKTVTATVTTSTTLTTTATLAPTFHCKSDVSFSHLSSMPKKGIVIDDVSFIYCPDQLLGTWPNTREKVSMIRTNAPWRSFFGDEAMRNNTLMNLVKFIKDNDAQVLVGQDATCNETSDDIEWELNLELMKLIGKEHIMGVAIGNEMDILWQHSDWFEKDFPNCINDLWEKEKYWNAFHRRVAEMDKVMGTSNIPVTSVWTAGFAYSGDTSNPFQEDPKKGLVRSFVKRAYANYSSRWVWTFNPYPIWSPGLQPDKDDTTRCDKAIALTKGPIAADMIAITRNAVKIVTKNDDDRMWAGEYGWSSPASDGMDAGIFSKCKNYTSLQTFSGYYEHFLNWNLGLSEATKPEYRKLKGLDAAFFFTMRDANNGAAHEYFGLVEKCGDKTCKIKKSALPTMPPTTPPTKPPPPPTTPPTKPPPPPTTPPTKPPPPPTTPPTKPPPPPTIPPTTPPTKPPTMPPTTPPTKPPTMPPTTPQSHSPEAVVV